MPHLWMIFQKLLLSHSRVLYLASDSLFVGCSEGIMRVRRCGGRRRRRLAGQLVGERAAADERKAQRRAGPRLGLRAQRQRVLAPYFTKISNPLPVADMLAAKSQKNKTMFLPCRGPIDL